ncbi:hypothetical protein [Billgrantia endophytica]|uniref:DUF4136 domain-containing protein n=1 Tax=Billgrantia endophytica TaxID=2033802 RepID=A0A2N7TVB8_9GAMM|nr:hypothetical protein [Halomonas endophytica]PMR72120.1 hypothetical protein C1H69_22350 [Halomonas endophytica]
MRPWWLLPCLLVLAGCQISPAVLPSAEPRPAAECRWDADGTEADEWVRRALTALENDGFVVRHTELTLGLVNAERTRTVPGYGGFDERDRLGLFGGYGVGGGRGGVSSGVMIGFGGGGGRIMHDATRLERVSVVADDSWVRVSRDIQVIDWRGEIRESRSASDARFCTQLRNAMTTARAGEDS